LRTISGAAGTVIPNTPGYLIIHTAIGGSASTTPNPATFPQTMEIDYAQIS
jgi:beta-glucanase (GH16 family)